MTRAKGSKLSRDIWGLSILVLALLLVLSLVSYDPRDRSFNTPSGKLDTHNWTGVLGAYAADFLLQAFGLSSFLVPVFPMAIAYRCVRAELAQCRLSGWIGGFLAFWSSAIVIGFLTGSEIAREGGGILGGLSQHLLVHLFGVTGAYVITASLAIVGLILLLKRSVVDLVEAPTKKLIQLSLQSAVVELKEATSESPPQSESRPLRVQGKFKFTARRQGQGFESQRHDK